MNHIMQITKLAKSNMFLIAILAFLYFFAAELRYQLILHTHIVSTIIFPSEGIALAFAIYFGKKVWPGVFFGQFFIAFGNGLDIPSSLFISAINSFEVILAAALFKDFNLNKKLENFKDIIGLSLLILFILQPFSAISSNLTLLYFGHIQSNEFLHSTFSWWFGNIMGQFLYTPLLLILFNSYKEIEIKSLLLYNLTFGFYVFILFYFFHISSSLLLLSMTLPILLYVVYLKNPLFSLSMIVVISYIISFFMTFKNELFHYQNGTINIIDYNFYLLTLTLTILTAKILFENQKKQEEQLQKRIRIEVKKNQEQQLLMLHQNRLAQMGEMIAMIAHQWRQPLNNLALLHQLIISKYKKNKLDDALIEYFQNNAATHVNMMSETINDFKNFFKPQEKQQQFNINEVILNILNMITPTFQKEHIEVVLLAKNSYLCYGYKNSLGHVILNIVNNAREALLDKDIEEKKIVIELTENRGNVLLTISDNAGGIPEDIIEKIFDPYFSTKHEKNGTGLGLYMTQMIITEHMHSEIKVHNSEEGAIFQIILKGEICEKIT